MKPFVWKEGMSAEEEANGAYWERNMLALYFAIHSNKAWNEFVKLQKMQGVTNPEYDRPAPSGWYYHGEWEGFSRVISIFDGKITFHVPDDFDLGDLPKIKPNWDGHTTEEKWTRLMKTCGVKEDIQHNPVMIYTWSQAPEEYRVLSGHGGDEDYVVVMSADKWEKDFKMETIVDALTICDYEVHSLANGNVVIITSHA